MKHILISIYPLMKHILISIYPWWNAVLYNATKTLAFASYFAKCQLKFWIDNQPVNWYFQNIFILSPILSFNLNSDFDYPIF